MILLIDNYDSFTFNLAQYLGELGDAPLVRRNDEMTIGDIENADELFFSGTAVEIMPVTEVDGRRINDGKPGQMTKQIQKTFFDIVHGREPRYRAWLATAASERALELVK